MKNKILAISPFKSRHVITRLGDVVITPIITDDPFRFFSRYYRVLGDGSLKEINWETAFARPLPKQSKRTRKST